MQSRNNSIEEFEENCTSTEPITTISQDGFVTKQIIKHGLEDQLPQTAQEAKIIFLAKDESGAKFDTRPNRKNPYKFRVGEKKIVDAIDFAV